MRNIQLLDCTLRDGGYVNDWNFGSLAIRSIVTRLDYAGIDIIECGFLNSRVEYDKNRSIYPSIPSIAETLRTALPKRAELVAMIEYGTFDRHLLLPQSDSVLNGIRLIFKKEHIDEALDYACEIKRLGYSLFLNPVAFSSYQTSELLNLVEKINKVEPYAMSIVDTYGLMFNHDMEKSITLVDAVLSPGIALGYHVHNNLEMANGHCISFIKRKPDRRIIVDSSILGMGKNAGNARTEVMAAFLDKTGVKQLDLNQILECAYTDIKRFSTQSTWGYSLENFISAIHDCSPNWTKFLMNKNTLSVSGVRTILNGLPYEKREVSYYSNELAEQKYLEYMDKHVNDENDKAEIRAGICDRDILLICPGKTLSTHRTEIKDYINEKKPVVISVNFITNAYVADFAFISNPRRYSQMLGKLPELTEIPKVILTSNITPIAELLPDYVVNFKMLYETIKGDYSTGLLLMLLKSIGVAEVAIAGMDGFSANPEDSFSEKFMDMHYSADNVAQANIALRKFIADVRSGMSIEFITPSSFDTP